jgi:hypothetical protein
VAIKLVFFYNQGASGFSETYYVPGSDPKAAVQTIDYATAVNLSFWRHPNCYLWAVRGSTVVPPKSSYLQIWSTYFKGTGSTTAFDTWPDVQSTDCVVRLSSTNNHSRRVYFRGLRDMDVMTSPIGVAQPSAWLANGISNAAASMQAKSFQIRFTQLPPDAGLLWHGVVSVQPSLLTNYMASATVGAGEIGAFNKGDLVIFQGADHRVLMRFPRVARIVQIDTVGGKFDFAYAIPGGQMTITPKLRVTKLVYAYDNISGHVIERFSEHKTGRFFGQLRGKSKGVKLSPL